jgi:hypothetical protein
VDVGEFLSVSRKTDDVVRVEKVKFKQTGGATAWIPLSPPSKAQAFEELGLFVLRQSFATVCDNLTGQQ